MVIHRVGRNSGDISERSSKGVMGPLGNWVGSKEEKWSWYFSPLFFPWSEAVPKLFVTQHVSEQTPHLQLTPPSLRTASPPLSILVIVILTINGEHAGWILFAKNIYLAMLGLGCSM